jgi:predicted esterase
MKEHSFTVEKTTRYYTLGDFDTADKLFLVLHGYGQLPQYFIRKFQSLTDKGYFIIAPEGLHRFYLEGTSGRVGASWMTREARMDDIQDNLVYLKSLTDYFVSKKSFKTISLLGFSQGGATASRFYSNYFKEFDTCILWASVFPDDVPLEIENKILNYQFVVGTEDPYFSQNSIEKLLDEYQKLNIKTHLFKGTHTIDIELLNQLFEA